ncbi:hypothetical protein CANCADRAFT_92625 [Tortispora caseinolytica NRRL Y-17796]|uniref:ATP-grasp domain-containing protein n=1 Tax=Tortispora caseinolytica NRRL Y-17796 TaxID=767744 RepID=A0A1E4TLY0_9ASCO|nr:hypothetical protein CANCADRAFT_92625 [Tortispora caseinolytica NRRL Y-17796]
MNVLVIGNGGREHAICWKLSQSALVDKIFAAPGNGGTSLTDKTANIDISASDFPALVEFATKNDIGLVVPGPEQPLVDGIESHFRKVGIPVFGPSAAAAQMEGSKTFSKDFMARHNIPTAAYANFSDFDAAVAYVNSVDHRVVIKASGLAAGKGVLIPESKQQAIEALQLIMVQKEFGSAGSEVVIEEYLEGDELSILAFSDGYTVLDLPPAQDHKRALDGDKGLNTGGMGAYAPAPIGTPELIQQIRQNILKPTVDGMRHDGFPMVGMLFVGIMLTTSGPKVLEYNVRFGDPETQTLLPLLESDLSQIMLACATHTLDAVKFSIRSGFAATVVMAAGGYPGPYEKGDIISIADTSTLANGTYIFHAGTSINSNNELVTNGGRVIAVSAVSDTLEDAVIAAYKGVNAVSFKGKYNRTDIAHRAFRDANKAPEGLTYAAAGVSVARGNELVQEIKAIVKSTKRPGTDSDIGGFGGLFDLKAAGYVDPLLVAATDGVGSKLMLATAMNKHSTVGIDLVAMNVNDLVVQGAEPLMFLDYFACSKLDIQIARDFVFGVAEGCKMAGCALVGGETSEMPGLYHGNEYDTNGTAVGAVAKDTILPRKDAMKAGDVLLGLGSDGIHSNGFSLVRKIVERSELSYTSAAPFDPTKLLGDVLLAPTRIYVKPVLKAVKTGKVLGLSHITGGGLLENIPRALPSHLAAELDATSWPRLPVFDWLQKTGNVPVDDMCLTFNNGIGMVCIVPAEAADEIKATFQSEGEKVYTIGTLVNKSKEAVIVKNKFTWA